MYPEASLCTDNGAMIAYAGALRLSAGEADGSDIGAAQLANHRPLPPK